MNDFFRKCSTCRTPIAYGHKYYKCSVSTCNKKATALYFCSVPCWDAHVPDARHRDAWAEEEVAPARPSGAGGDAADGPRISTETESLTATRGADEVRVSQVVPKSTSPSRRIVSGRSPEPSADQSASSATSAGPSARAWAKVDDGPDVPRDVLVVMSKVKGYIKAKSGLRTSDGVSDPLSDHVRAVLTRALKSAAANERTTVLARDVEAALRGENATD